MSILVWAMIGIAVWHFAVLVPDRFAGGIIGALLAALCGALASGFLLPLPGVPADNPPGLMAAFWALPGSLLAMAASYWYGARRLGDPEERIGRQHGERRPRGPGSLEGVPPGGETLD